MRCVMAQWVRLSAFRAVKAGRMSAIRTVTGTGAAWGAATYHSSEWRPIRRSGFESSSRHHVFVLALPESPPFNYQPQLGPGVKPLLKGFASERYSGHQLTDHAPPMSSGIPTPNEIFGSAPASRKIQAGLKPLIVIPD